MTSYGEQSNTCYTVIFFDKNQAEVGRGSLVYSATPFQGVFCNLQDKIRVQIDTRDNWFEVIYFEAKIAQLAWSIFDQEDIQLFWSPTQLKISAISFSTAGEPSQVDSWSFTNSSNLSTLTLSANQWEQIYSNGKKIGHTWIIQPQ
ncbi:MAG: hypothetical protein SWJ54_10280 [Cyanobacteriota bacterium]|nr:hypothetical protein [Cyanobacteriota bacterium]